MDLAGRKGPAQTLGSERPKRGTNPYSATSCRWDPRSVSASVGWGDHTDLMEGSEFMVQGREGMFVGARGVPATDQRAACILRSPDDPVE